MSDQEEATQQAPSQEANVQVNFSKSQAGDLFVFTIASPVALNDKQLAELLKQFAGLKCTSI